jgi:transcriptional regulator NrdR family protein
MERSHPSKETGMDECIGCPKCGAEKTAVAESREFANEFVRSLKRRRKCGQCGHRYHTLEVPFELAQEIYQED